jgi:general secretion pathway protein D
VLNCPFWSTRVRGPLLALVLPASILAGCVTSDPQGGTRAASGDVVAQVREIDLSARYPRRVGTADTSPNIRPQTQSYYGDGTSATVEVPDHGTEDPATTGALPLGAKNDPSNQGYELNFENTPVATVAKTVLGDILGVGYSIDPRVQATVSLSSGRPVPKKDILFVLESALRVSNVAIVREARGYRLIPASEAPGTGSIEGASDVEAGYGITVVPLRFVSAQTLTKLIDSFASKPGTVRADPARNLVVIQGSAADRRAVIDTVMSFDADWMRGQSVGIYPVSNSTPEPVITELERIIDAGEGGLSQSLVKLQPIARQNAILVVTRKPELLRTVSAWITRLDKSGSAGTSVKVYRMRYGDARQVAELLNGIFTGNSSSGLDTPSNQLVPGGSSLASTRAPTQNGGAATNGSPQPASGSFDERFADATGGKLAQSTSSSVYSPGGGAGATPILSGVRIAADSVNNAVLIYANQENYHIIERALQQIDRPQLQVAIDATIAEVTLNDTLNYGVQFFLKSNNVGLPANSGSIVNTTSDAVSSSAAGALLSRVLPGFNFLVGTEAQPQVILNALHEVTNVKVLSNPSLVVVDNHFATLQVGDQIPVSTGTATVLSSSNTVVNTVDYRNTGVILRVAPRVNANGNVLLDIEQEISSVADNANATTLTPTVSQRKVRSSIAVASGQTVLLAGLISETQNRGRTGIPGLDQVPGLGTLFSNTTGTAHRTELIIFIRPQIIRNGSDATRIAEELRNRLKGRFASEPPPRATGACCNK